MHQDSGYMLPHCDDSLVVTCWVPLVDATVERGCLHVLPWRHSEGVLPHCTPPPGSGYIEIVEDSWQGRQPIPVEMKRGDVLFLHNHTP